MIELPPYQENDRLHYKIPVKKIWDLEPTEFQNKFYALLPFKVFAAIKQLLDFIEDQEVTLLQRKDFVHQELVKVIKLIASTQDTLVRLLDENKLTHDDLNKMNTSIMKLSHDIHQKCYPFFEK